MISPVDIACDEIIEVLSRSWHWGAVITGPDDPPILYPRCPVCGKQIDTRHAPDCLWMFCARVSGIF